MSSNPWFFAYSRNRREDERLEPGTGVFCDVCGVELARGDWPYCKNRNPETHKR